MHFTFDGQETSSTSASETIVVRAMEMGDLGTKAVRATITQAARYGSRGTAGLAAPAHTVAEMQRVVRYVSEQPV